MKKLFYIPIAVVVLLTALAPVAQSQTSGAPRIVANIPFTFEVGKKVLPAGSYTITVLNPASDRKVLQLRSADGRATAVTLTQGVKGDVSDNAKLVFEQWGDHYVFVKVQLADDATNLAAVRSKSQRWEKEPLATAAKKSVIVIVAG
jgi:hypothetical protein